MEEEEEEIHDSYKKGLILVSIAILIVCFIGGIITNVLFIRRNKGFTKEKEKLSDVKFFSSLLAVFNILYLIDVFRIVVYLIDPNISIIAPIKFCTFYSYYLQCVILGMFYCIITCSRDCYILSLNNPKYKYSNRCQMILEAFTVWSMFFLLFFVLSFFPIGKGCYKSFDTIPSEFLSIVMSFISLIFTAMTHCKAKKLNLQDSQTTHIICQSRKVCFIYFILWIPSIYMTVTSGHYLISYHENFYKEEYEFRLFTYVLEYLSAALFPLLYKTRRNVVVEHELL